MPGRIENPVQLLGSAQSAFLLTKHFRGTEAVVIAFAMSPMRLSIIIGHKALMSQLRSLPTRHLLEMHLAHAPHHVKMGLDKILPALTCMDIFLLDLQCLANGKQLLRAKNAAVVRDEALRCSKLLDCRIQDNEHTCQILALKDIAGENSAREGV